MTNKAKPFTGRHMAAVFVGGFGIVIAVNLFMAYNAVGGFHGTVVDNSYVASQKYNGWLAKAAASEALGWQVIPERRADGRVVLETLGLPEGAVITAEAERPLGQRETIALTFAPEGQGRWLSTETLAAGRWQVRMAIRAPGAQWAGEAEVQ
ncbi:MAG: FixH family protein [Sphingomonadales bacterium]|nr:FixH family protein [Sphingomonadales bacterium]NCQ20772.1 FixH family protein [Sphingomonadales bacterium]NCT03771.1 FixH family protein [Sphingomonadales bacterium]